MILNFHSGPNEISKIFIEREAEEERELWLGKTGRERRVIGFEDA